MSATSNIQKDVGEVVSFHIPVQLTYMAPERKGTQNWVNLGNCKQAAVHLTKGLTQLQLLWKMWYLN